MKEFLTAAFPWIVLGLALVVAMVLLSQKK